MHVGIDFGTSNTAIARTDERGDVQFLEFSLLGTPTHSYRSLLFFDPEAQEVGSPIEFHAGTGAIAAYLDALGEGRLVQSFKTHLTTESLGRTQIGHHAVSLDDMLVLFFNRVREHVEQRWGQAPTAVTLGRPVRFAGADAEADNAMAQTRLEAAAKRSGFETVAFQLEPIAAAFHYERTLSAPELALVADFGGGTTDFCLMRLGGDDRGRDRQQDIIATGGVGVAGDDLDAAIIEHVVSPQLGKGTRYREMGREKAVPSSYYYKLSRWHHLSFLRGKRVRAELERLLRASLEPEKIEAFIHVLENNQGFHLHKAVERLKIALSSTDTATFRFEDDPVEIEASVRRSDFERWIAPCVASITTALDDTLAQAGLSPDAVDRVFMTGGTAFVPSVRRQFEQRFGARKLSGGDELMSIASGLAVRG
jgi:hypothetical chaperone protein